MVSTFTERLTDEKIEDETRNWRRVLDLIVFRMSEKESR